MAINLFHLSAEQLRTVKSRSPYDKGNLRDNGIVLLKTGLNEFTIFIGGSNAPYAVYTNEVWVAPLWRDKRTGKMRKNPNEHWIDLAVEAIVDNICARYGGRLETISGIDDRWINKSYWESDEGVERLRRYRISDYKSVVS